MNVLSSLDMLALCKLGAQLTVKVSVMLLLLMALAQLCSVRHSAWRNLIWRIGVVA